MELNVDHLLNVLSAKNPYILVLFFGVWRSRGLAYVQFSLKLKEYDDIYALFSILFTGYCHRRHEGHTA
jgi:hypothetical protein